MKKAILKQALSLTLALVLLIAVVPMVAIDADAAAYTGVVRQTDAPWTSYYVGGATLAATGCGLFSLVNCVGYLTGQLMDIPSLASWAHSTGTFNKKADGTYRLEFYPLVEAKYGAQYGITVDCNTDTDGWWGNSYSSLLKERLQQGWVAIGNVPGHFIAIVDYDPASDSYHIYESAPSSKRGTLGNGDIWRSAYDLYYGDPDMKLRWFCFIGLAGERITTTHKLENRDPVNMGQDFYARINHPASGKYIADQGGPVYASDLSGGNEQVWHFMRQTSGAYLVGNVATYKFLEVKDASYADGTPLVTSDVDYENNQKFFIYAIDNKFHFMPEGGDKVVDVAAGTLITQIYGTNRGEDNQVAVDARAFNLEIISTYEGQRNPANLGDSFQATIKNVASGKYVTASGYTLIGADRSKADNQKFNFTRLPNGAYTIVSQSENLALDVLESSLDEGKSIDMYNLHGGNAQTYFLIEKDGKYYIKSTYTLNTLHMDATSLDFYAYTTGDDATKLAAQLFEIKFTNVEEELVIKDTSKYTKDEGSLVGVTSGQTAADLLANFDNELAVVVDVKGAEISATAFIGTGCAIILVVEDEKIETLEVVIKGDVTGDGVTTSTDLIAMRNVLKNRANFEGAFLKAADLNADKAMSTLDYVQMTTAIKG